MNIQFKCPKCRAPLLAPTEMAGRKAKCRECKAVVLVPDPERDLWPPGMAPPRPDPQPKSPAQPAAPTSAVSPPAETGAEKPPPPRAVPVASPSPIAKPSPAPPTAKRAPTVPVALSVPSPNQPRASDDSTGPFEFEPIVPRAPAPTAPDIDANPYRSPTSQATGAVRSSAGRTKSQPISYSQAISTTWEIFKANLGMCVAGTLLSAVLLLGASYAGTVALSQLGLLIVQPGGLAVFLIWLFFYVGYQVVLLVFALLGLTNFMLAIARGKRANFADLFAGGPMLASGTAIFLLLVLGTLLGAIALLVPGIVFGLFFSLAPIALVDKKTGIIESFKISAAAMKPNILTVLLINMSVSFGANLLTSCTGGIGLLVTIPFSFLLFAVIYLTATGQEIGVPSSARSVPE